jgi:hypothetical protein
MGNGVSEHSPKYPRPWPSGRSRGSFPLWAMALAVFVLSFALLCVGARTRPLQYDELYHLLAARSWAADHGLAIAEGEYRRARLYTILTGLAIKALGWSPLVGRLPAIAGGAMLVTLLFAATEKIAGRRTAVIAAFLLGMSQDLAATAQFARFYTLHAVTIWIFARNTYLLSASRCSSPLRQMLRAITAVCALLLAFHLQPMTAIGAVAAVAASISIYATDHGRLGRLPWMFAAAAVAASAALVTAISMGLFEQAYAMLRSAPPWAARAASRPTFYYAVLTGSLGWMIHLFPIALLASWSRVPKPALFSALYLAVALGLHSAAAMKAPRYIFYLSPVIVMLWAVAIDRWCTCLTGWLERSFVNLSVPARRFRFVLLAIAIATPALIGVPAYRSEAVALLHAARGTAALSDGDPVDEDIDWTPFVPVLRRMAAVDMFVTADDLRALHYLGGYDLLLSRTVLWDQTRREFGRDGRTGGHGISTVRSLAQTMRCYRSGAILISNRRWRSADVGNEVADFIERTTTRMALPAGLRMRAYRWKTDDIHQPARCRWLRQQIGDARSGAIERLVHLRS